MKKNILHIGIQDFSEKMYPHFYEVTNHLKANFNLTYYYPTLASGSKLHTLSLRYSLVKTDLVFCVKRLKLLYSLLAVKKIIYNLYLLFGLLVENYKLNQQIREEKYKIEKILREGSFDGIIVQDLFNITLLPDLHSEKMKKYFWSTEIISQDHPWYQQGNLIKRLLIKSQKGLQAFDRIFIQDYNRAAVFDNQFNTHNIPKTYLPVSIGRNEQVANTRKIRENADTIVLSQFGSITPIRASLELIQEYQHCPENIKLYLKGNITPEIHEIITTVKNKPVTLGLSDSFNEMRQFISTIDIGFIGHNTKNINNHFYSMATGQYVELASQAIPVIVYGLEEFGDFVERQACGVTVNLKKPGDLLSAINRIMANYGDYSIASKRTFEKYYDLNHTIKPILSCIGA
ncbi:MAG: glycosyltransferase family 1 protein [Bacteroidetes bacterium]|nr:MAG: glycosyltransferase family 1 protein [Bacteroidota bacterium]